MNTAFDLCVQFLVWAAQLTGLTYKEINVVIFLIIWPLVTIAQTVAVVRLWRWKTIHTER